MRVDISSFPVFDNAGMPTGSKSYPFDTSVQTRDVLILGKNINIFMLKIKLGGWRRNLIQNGDLGMEEREREKCKSPPRVKSLHSDLTDGQFSLDMFAWPDWTLIWALQIAAEILCRK